MLCALFGGLLLYWYFVMNNRFIHKDLRRSYLRTGKKLTMFDKGSTIIDVSNFIFSKAFERM